MWFDGEVPTLTHMISIKAKYVEAGVQLLKSSAARTSAEQAADLVRSFLTLKTLFRNGCVAYNEDDPSNEMYVKTLRETFDQMPLLKTKKEGVKDS